MHEPIDWKYAKWLIENARTDWLKTRELIDEKWLFRVKAINDEGESEPLEGDKPIKAKNPFGKLFSFHSFSKCRTRS